MIARNCFGEITPRIGKYVVEKRHDGKWEINKEEYCLKTTAAIANEVMLWLDIEPFDSMVKAYAWLETCKRIVIGGKRNETESGLLLH